MRFNLVFRDAIDPQDFTAFAEEQKWTFQGIHPAAESAPEEAVWATPTGVGVHLIDDEALGLIYVSLENYSIQGTRESDLREASQSVSKRFGTIPPQELVDLYHAEPDWNGKVLALMMMAASAGEFDANICEAIEGGLKSPNADVRSAAAIGSMYTPWDELRELVDSVSIRDPDDRVRDLAAMSLLNFA